MVHNILNGVRIALLTHVSILDESFFNFGMSVESNTNINEVYHNLFEHHGPGSSSFRVHDKIDQKIEARFFSVNGEIFYIL